MSLAFVYSVVCDWWGRSRAILHAVVALQIGHIRVCAIGMVSERLGRRPVEPEVRVALTHRRHSVGIVSVHLWRAKAVSCWLGREQGLHLPG